MMDDSTVLANGLMLTNWWSPLILVAAFGGWAWVVSTIYDKDAARHYMPRRRWNMIHLGAGAGALVLVMALPLPFFVVIPAAVGILLADLLAYFAAHNSDERVPESHRWSFDLKKMAAARQGKKSKAQAASSTMVFKGPEGEVPVPAKDTPEFEVRAEGERLIQKLADARGSQLDILPLKDGAYGVTAIVDGVRQPLEAAAVPAARAVAIMDLYKAAAGLDLKDRRRRLQGDFKLGPAKTGATTGARVTTMGSAAGMQLSLLLDPEGQVKREVENLGLHENQLKNFNEIVSEKKGVVLVVAPPDNGRTTTLYSLIRAHDAYTSNVQTIEMEPQLAMEGVRQNRFDPKVDGAEYSTTVRSILRRDPDVVGVAEMPDDNTGKEVSKADIDRTRVYLCMPLDGAFTAIQVYAKAVGDQKAAAKSLTGVIAQRLARRLCENCRVEFAPTAEVIKKLGLPADTKRLFRKGGQVLIKDKPVTCPVCNGSGFFGQIGVFEVYPIGAPERELIAQNDLTGLKAAFRQKKQQSIQQAALMHAISGATSVEEVVRITQPPAPAKGPSEPDANPAPAKPAAPGAAGGAAPKPSTAVQSKPKP
ncbi:MAG: Flp pilus assembly complex ATPase component TadA [Phycisphaerae bacterium]|nr:Flp pilus assembly complex ATPase component TadA [Phycisphaerae bacterium]